MAFITLRQLLDHAAEHSYGVPAFNINNMEQLLAIMQAAKQTDAPVILQASRGARSYAGDLMLRRMVETAVEMNPGIPVCLHQDHGDTEATCLSAIQTGFTSVMMDGSLLAVAIGTSHGAYKFKSAPTGEVLAMDVIARIHARLPNTHLVMHGSSSVPQELRALFNEFGGDMPATWGVPVEELQRGIRSGVRKINIDTDCRLAMAAKFRRVATTKRGEFDPRNFMKPAMAALTRLCAWRTCVSPSHM
jgi:fructose/tagatose bisphosphate aldolase